MQKKKMECMSLGYFTIWCLCYLSCPLYRCAHINLLAKEMVRKMSKKRETNKQTKSKNGMKDGEKNSEENSFHC